jgi:hypothetical protein
MIVGMRLGGLVIAIAGAGCELVFSVSTEPPPPPPDVDAAFDGSTICGDRVLALDFDAPITGTGVVDDLSGCGNHAMTDAIGLRPFAGHGNAIRVEKSPAPSTVAIAESATLELGTTGSFAMWINAEAVDPVDGHGYPLVNRLQYALTVYSNEMVQCVFGTSQTAPAYIEFGTWVHVGCTYDGTTVSTYIDGSRVGCHQEPSPFGDIGSNGTRIGHFWDGTVSVSYFIGMIDEVRVYQNVLSDLEICTLAGAKSCSDACK